ncbi:MAG: hypothetical protein FD174_2873 [Geobacteraceae bacterium]|nr:MAG: hypothetical protein FD174_2873 [Geobacteraceae bacterium]
MSLKVPCKYCGKEISLRKMPNGQFVPFDKGTNTQHRCQDQQESSTTKSGSAKPHVHVDAGTSVGDLVFRVVSESPGMKAKSIASTISKKYGVNVDRSEVNRWLYHDLKGKVYQNGSYQWFPGGAPQRPSSAGQSQPQGAPPEVRTGPTGTAGSGVQQSSNKLLWAIIVLLVIVVLILLRR